MSVDKIRGELKEYAKDIKLNLGSVLTEEGSLGLSLEQIYGVALACAYTTRNQGLIKALSEDLEGRVSENVIKAAKASSTIMAMNNIYYRFAYLVSDQEYRKMPANLRMNIMSNSGVEKEDFELYSLAVSALNGCGICMDSHEKRLTKAGVKKTSIQSAIRIAAVVNATAQAIEIQ